MTNYRCKTFISIALCTLTIAFHMQAMEQEEPGEGASNTRCPQAAPLMVHPVNREVFGFSKHTPKETYFGQLQKIASYLSFQHHIIKRADWYDRTPLERLKQEKAITELFPLVSAIQATVGNLIGDEEGEDFIKTNLIRIYLQRKLSQCQAPSMRAFKAFDFLSKLRQITNMSQNIFCPSRLLSNEQANRCIQSIKKHLTEHFDRYFEAINSLIIDDQYREIIRVLRLEVSRAQKLSNGGFSSYLLDLYTGRNTMEPELKLLDYLLSDRDREDMLRTIEPPAPHQEEEPAPPPCAPKPAKKATKAKTMPKPKTVKPPCIRPHDTYHFDAAYVECDDNFLSIHDPGNTMIIHFDLDPDIIHVHPLSDYPPKSLFCKYSTSIQNWFANTWHEIKRSRYKKYSRYQKDRLIQQQRFSPLVDQFIHALGREYLDLEKDCKKTTIILDHPANMPESLAKWVHTPESLVVWLHHAACHGMQATIRVELDALVHLLNSDEHKPCTFIYHIDPATHAITYRFMCIDENSIPQQ